MKILDFSHSLTNTMTVFNNAERPVISRVASIESQGYAQFHVSMYSHNGTHIDAPAHILKGRPHLDDFPPEKFTGKAIVIDCTGTGTWIGEEILKQNADKIEEVDFVLLRTGWDEKWGTENYIRDFPVLTPAAAQWLIRFPLKGVGTDAISFDPYSSTDLPVHKIFLGRDLILIENLRGLKKAGETVFTFSCFPLPFEEADGSPVRAVGYMD